ncbi:hypothetical protein PUNSTDRAFT_57552 [Punctularia strigosozonata HHB-11173 SS5]|uniref:uncharacterized protein n=1 Tax=Punctularia strigosozonata (strain HHB-11173) TaxID=741275 RepID=UPI0004417BFF|nr:uncharacterized protein PUNSTDRAFT_57552 [Punctularia strigosozonata HHB-11173 SS5]EIN13775.1 hypothetical protein PUNSTDRAFT_57552 [Punctularia strigosozonata HHB-11173 SS5]
MAGPSASNAFPPPPSFEESVGHTLVELGGTNDSEAFSLLPGGEDAPPDFTPYEAECSIHSGGVIVSHDPHLNTDGEALYRFLISQAAAPPTYVVHCKGEHTESRTRYIHGHDSNGRSTTRTEHYNETVVDFNFSIDVGQHIVSGPVHWSIADNEPAYRGRMFQQVDSLFGGRTKAARRERKAAQAWRKERAAKGLPPWVGLGDAGGLAVTDETHHVGVLKSSKTLREWADDYCGSDKYLKEFVYEKVVYGWNVGALEAATRAAILSTGYKGIIMVSFDMSHSKICVRSDNRLSRALSNKWLKVLFFITLILPFIWLYKRFHSRGGGRWEVCGGAYAMKQWQQADEEDVGRFGQDAKTSALVREEGGTRKLVGVREGEWFRNWESTIRTSVGTRLIDTIPMTMPIDARANPAAAALDGYL